MIARRPRFGPRTVRRSTIESPTVRDKTVDLLVAGGWGIVAANYQRTTLKRSGTRGFLFVSPHGDLRLGQTPSKTGSVPLSLDRALEQFAEIS